MSSLTRTMLPAFALVAMMSIAQAQTTGQNRDAHHPGGTAAMPGQGMGSGAVVQPGTQQSGTQQSGTQQPGMMGNMGQMMPMMRQMMMGQQGGMGMGGMGMGMPFEHVEGRIAFLKAELKITDAQAPQWNAFAETLRSNAMSHRAAHQRMTTDAAPATWPERIAFQQKMLSTRLDGLKDMEAAVKPLYATLSDEQRKLADQLMSGPMGMM
jgi:hypothetical protein